MQVESMDNSDSMLLTLLQICDSGFPTGGFSHSMGLECAVKQQFVTSKGSLKTYLACCLENIGSFSLPFVKEAHQNFADLGILKELDDLCSACISNHVAKRASTRQAQSIQQDLQMKIPDVIARNFHRCSHDACMVYPHVDIIQNMHDTMFSKLFYS